MAKVAKDFKIVAICQVYNELEKGNLKRFFTYLKPLVSDIIVFDDASTDGSYDYALKHASHVIRGSVNDFKAELSHKQQLLEKALSLEPDFIFWIDADEVCLGSRKEMQACCQYCIDKAVDGLNIHLWNLWRSATYRRTDSFFDDGWFTRFWRVRPGLSFGELKDGLHQRLVPPQIEKTVNYQNLTMLHYGFSDDRQIAYKYFTYKSHGQRGYLMLDRFIDESKLELQEIDRKFFPKDLWKKEEAPRARTIQESFDALENYRSEVRRPKYSIICLIYKSIDWLNFAYEQVLKYTSLEDCEFFFVANNAEPEVIEYMRKQYIPFVEFNDSKRTAEEWHINGVYRAYNYGAQVAQGDFLIFINSDMAYSEDWLSGLASAFNTKNCVASRLVESGKLRTGTYGVERNFGKRLSEYKEEKFQAYAESLKSPEVLDSGLFMPLFVQRSHFLSVGGYPAGNIRAGSDIFNPVIAKKGEELISGDNVLMQRLATKGIIHQTAFSSVVYHFQAGELDESPGKPSLMPEVPVAVVNDIVTGTVGERVLWDFLLEGLPGAYGVDGRLVGKKHFEKKAKEYIDSNKPETQLIIQNASFIGSVDPGRHTIIFLQDDLRRMKLDSIVQEANLEVARTFVTNSVQTASSYPEYDFEVIPVGIDEKLFSPLDKKAMRKKHGIPLDKKVGIFVGSFSEVKGWSKIVDCITSYPDIEWLCVTKYEESFAAANAKVFARISQEKLVELLNASDFFILGSPVETQCLAALEAALCDIPVLMPLTGIFLDFTQAERGDVGIFTSDLKKGVPHVLKGEYRPRAVVLARNLTVSSTIKKWHTFLTGIITTERGNLLRDNTIVYPRKKYRKYQVGMLFRKKVLKRLIGREYVFPSTMKYALLRAIYKTLVKLGLEPLIVRIRRII